MHRLRNTHARRRMLIAYIAPAFALYTAFMLIPIVNSMRLSFYSGSGLIPTEFVGFDNYIKLFTRYPFSERFWNAFGNNIRFFVIVTLYQNVLGFLMAVLLTRGLPCSGVLRTISFVPTTLSVLVVGFLFSMIFNPVWGIFDRMLAIVGLESWIRPWLGDPATALPIISAVVSWQFFGESIVFYTAGIEAIDREMLESARWCRILGRGPAHHPPVDSAGGRDRHDSHFCRRFHPVRYRLRDVDLDGEPTLQHRYLRVALLSCRVLFSRAWRLGYGHGGYRGNDDVRLRVSRGQPLSDRVRPQKGAPVVKPTIDRRWAKAVAYAVMVGHTFIVVFPLYVMFVTSLKANRQIFTRPFALPDPLDLDGYLRVFSASDYGVYVRNSSLVMLLALLCIVVLTALAAYALAKYEFKGRLFLYVYFVVGLIVPIRLGTIGILKSMIGLALFDTLWSLVIVFVSIGIPLGVFILYNFIRMIPEELSNSARIDGASEHTIFRRIIVPLLQPALASVAIVNAIPIWNDFWFPLILIRSNDRRPVPLATALLFGQFETNFGMVFAVLSLASLPVMLFYLVMSRYFVEGLTSGALKG